MTDWNMIANEPDHLYRPYLWFGEDADAHVREFKRRRKLAIVTVEDMSHRKIGPFEKPHNKLQSDFRLHQEQARNAGQGGDAAPDRFLIRIWDEK